MSNQNKNVYIISFFAEIQIHDEDASNETFQFMHDTIIQIKDYFKNMDETSKVYLFKTDPLQKNQLTLQSHNFCLQVKIGHTVSDLVKRPSRHDFSI